MRKPTVEEQSLWPAPNFVNPEHLHAPVIGATVTTFILALLCEFSSLIISNELTCIPPVLCMRILSKRLFRKTLEADDYLMIAAMVTFEHITDNFNAEFP